jgi:Neocarzinostatin family
MDGETYEVSLDPDGRGPGLWSRLGVWLGIAALIVLGGAAVVLVGGSRDADDPPGLASDRSSGDEIVPIQVAGPYDGLESIGLPVVVDPSVGLVDGQTVMVNATGFTAGITVAIVQCWGLGDGSGSAQNCDAGNYALAGTDEQGAMTAEFVVRRFIGTDLGEKDCALDDGLNSCGIAVADINDYDRSGVTNTYFDPSVAGRAAPILTVEPTSGLSDGDTITVTGANFVPGETARITQCVMNTTGIPGCFSRNPTGEIQVDEQGNFLVSIDASRIVEGLAGPIDCVADPYGCRVVVAGELIPNPVWLTFEGSTRPPSVPSFTVSPSSGLVDGDIVAVELTDLQGTGETYLIWQCVDVQGGSACQTVDSGVTVDGMISSTVVVSREVSGGDGSTRDCAETGRRCYLRVETESQQVERLPIDFEAVG